MTGKLAGAHLGLVFEPFAHHMLATEGTWRICSLAEGGAEEEFKLSALSTVGRRRRVGKGSSAVGREVLRVYVPTDPTYAVVDSWTVIDMFQMTVSASHPIKSGSKQCMALKGKGPTRLIFVEPSGRCSAVHAAATGGCKGYAVRRRSAW
jgi:hypothetical protein